MKERDKIMTRISDMGIWETMAKIAGMLHDEGYTPDDVTEIADLMRDTASGLWDPICHVYDEYICTLKHNAWTLDKVAMMMDDLYYMGSDDDDDEIIVLDDDDFDFNIEKDIEDETYPFPLETFLIRDNRDEGRSKMLNCYSVFAVRDMRVRLSLEGYIEAWYFDGATSAPGADPTAMATSAWVRPGHGYITLDEHEEAMDRLRAALA